MKLKIMRIKRLFSLLPVLCISLISGLACIVSSPERAEVVRADADALVSNTAVTSRVLSYSNNSCTVFWTFDFNLSLYRNLSTGYYRYLVSLKQYFNRATGTGITYNNTYYQSSSNVNYREISFFLNDISIPQSTLNTNFTLFLTSINCPSGYYGGGAWHCGYTFDLSIQGLGHYYYSIQPSVYNLSDLFFMNLINIGTPSWATESTINYQGNFSCASYEIDLTYNNYDIGYADGYDGGYNAGFNDGFLSGADSGYYNGYQAGFDSRDGEVEASRTAGYNEGYSAGYSAGSVTDSTVASIFSGILQVGMLPVNVFLTIFNFEILGINISAFVSAILTVCLTIIVIRTVMGGKDDK